MDLVAQEFTDSFSNGLLGFYQFQQKAEDAFRVEFYNLIEELGMTISEALLSNRITFVQYQGKLDRGIWLDNKEHILLEFSFNNTIISWKISKRQ